MQIMFKNHKENSTNPPCSNKVQEPRWRNNLNVNWQGMNEENEEVNLGKLNMTKLMREYRK